MRLPPRRHRRSLPLLLLVCLSLAWPGYARGQPAAPAPVHQTADLRSSAVAATPASGQHPQRSPLAQTPPAPAFPQTPPAVSYRSIEGDDLTLYAYVGTHVALLAPSPDLDQDVAASIVATLDGVYTYYAQATGRTPYLYLNYAGRTTVAVVPSTCGYGCAYLGATGIELLTPAFDILYTGVRDRNEYDQVVFYEFGRNFWFYGDQVEYRGADDTGAITTGYAVFMRFMAMQATGAAPGPFGQYDFAYFEDEVVGLLGRCLTDPACTWDNTLRAGVAPPNPIGLGATDLFASILFDLRTRYGADLINRIWREVERRPNAVATQDAVDNFILAACAATNQNLTDLFVDHYRWPMSPSARQEAHLRFGPKVFLPTIQR
jgi:hypothetical protein